MENIPSLYGQLDLTSLGNLVRQHPELVREVEFKDGKHKLLNVDVMSKMQQDQYGNVASIKASCKKADRKEGVNYYLANLKVSQYQDQNQQKEQPKKANNSSAAEGNDDLPF